MTSMVCYGCKCFIDNPARLELITGFCDTCLNTKPSDSSDALG